MTRRLFRQGNRWLLPLALGLSDGILNALVLASSAVLRGTVGMSVTLAVRISIVALVTAVFTMFVAEYAQLRSELARAEHQLNLTSSGRLATGRLGRTVRFEAIQAAALAGGCSFLGSLTPLMIGAFLPERPWLPLAAAVVALGGLGLILARVVNGCPLRWAAAMMLGGLVAALIGVRLDLT